MNSNKRENKNIQVVVRVRPLNQSEKRQKATKAVEAFPEQRSIKVHEKVAPRSFTLDKVYGPNSKQVEIYHEVVVPILNEVLQGYNCTIFAYGPTGSGKTYTMEGERTDDPTLTWDKDPLAGIIPRALHQMFETLDSQEDAEYSVRVSFIELYNEDVYDLLGGSNDWMNNKLRLFEDPMKKGSVVIQGMEEVIVRDRDEIYEILEKGATRRQTAATLINAHSSRSHSVFTVTVRQKENTVDGEELLKTGKFHLVDLAGSECIGRSGAIDKRAREAGKNNINQSLLTLGRVITSLVERAPHVPYRESKLTRLLQDSLGGRTITTIIATVSPASTSLEETLSTLDYANRAKNIKNHPEINQKLTRKAVMKEYADEIERLRRDLMAARRESGFFVDKKNYEQMKEHIESQQKKIDDIETQLCYVSEQLSKRMEDMEIMERHYGRTYQKLLSTKTKLQDTTQELKDTQYKLASTLAELEKQQYLVEKYRQTEEALSQQANQLLTVSDQATGDTVELLAKIKRQDTVNQGNLKTTRKYKDEVMETLDEADKSLAKTKQQIVTHFKENCENLETIRSDSGKWASSADKAITESNADLETKLKALSDELKSRSKTNLGALTNSEESSRKLKMTINSRVDDFVASLKSDFNTITAATDSGLERISQVQENIDSQKINFAIAVKTRVSEHEIEVNELLSHSNEHRKLQQECVSHINQQIKSVKNEYETTLANMREQLESSMMTMQSQMESRFITLSQMLSDLNKKEEVDCIEQNGQATNIKTKWLEWTSEQKGVSERFSEETATQCHKASTQLQTINGSAAKLHSNTDASADQIKQISSCDTANLLSQLFSQKKALESQGKNNQSALEEIGSASKTTTECLTKLNDTQAESLDQMAQMQLREINENSESFLMWNAGHSDVLMNVGERAKNLVGNDMKEVVVTGSTPPRRRFSYPRDLVCTDPRQLLEEYDEFNLPIDVDMFAQANRSRLEESIMPMSPGHLREELSRRDICDENTLDNSGDTLTEEPTEGAKKSRRKAISGQNERSPLNMKN